MPDTSFTDPFDSPIDQAQAQRAVQVEEYQRAGSAKRNAFSNALEAKFPGQLAQEPGHVGAFIDPYDSMREPVIPSPDKASAANFGASVKAGFAQDEGTKRRLIANRLFPGDPHGEKRVGFDNGTPVYVDQSGTLRRVSGPLSTFVASMISQSPEMAGAIGGTIAGGPVVGAAAGGGLARFLKRGAMHLAVDEPVSVGSMAKEVGSEMAIDATAGLAGKVITGLSNKGAIVDFSPNNIGAAEGVRNRVKATTGIDIDLAQASGNRKLIEVRNFLAEHPTEASDLLQAADELTKGQFEAATNRVMEKIATAKPAEVAGRSAMNAAKAVIDLAKAQRQQLAQPFYEKAGKQTLGFDVLEAFSKDPVLANTANRVQSSPIYQRELGITGKSAHPDSVKFWHLVRQNLDDQIGALEGKNKANEVRILSSARKSLDTQLKSASPDLKAGDAIWEKNSRDVIKPLEDSPVGVLARITDGNAAKAAAKVLRGVSGGASADEIHRTRMLLEGTQPGSFNGIVRQWIGENFDLAMRTTQSADNRNAAGKLMQRLYGSPDAVKKTNAMLGPAAPDFKDLMFAAERLAKTTVRGSQTNQKGRIEEALKGRGWASIIAWMSPRSNALSLAEKRALDNGVEEVTRAILDPNTRAQLRRVVKLKPSAEQAIRISAILAGQSAKPALPGDSSTPEVLRQ